MKRATLIIALFVTTHVLGQPIQKIKQLLINKDFASLNSYMDKPTKSNVNFYWESLRSIVGDYQEGVIKIEESNL